MSYWLLIKYLIIIIIIIYRDSVYGAVIMTNVGQRQAAADPQTRSTDLDGESICRLLSPTSTIASYYWLNIN